MMKPSEKQESLLQKMQPITLNDAMQESSELESETCMRSCIDRVAFFTASSGESQGQSSGKIKE
jgi:hypothetical protein